MDITKTYIKMVDLPEIQDKWNPHSGDWYFRKYTVFGDDIDKTIWGEGGLEEIHILQWQSQYIESYWKATNEKGDDRIVTTKEMYRNSCIWLPRRDQLETISGLGWEQFDDKCFMSANRYLKSRGKEYCADEIAVLVSKEQAGIMVVMNELYKKKWDGSVWRNI